MSGTSVSVGGGEGYYYNRGVVGPCLFTELQWKELEHQALIYKYLVAGMPVPTDLLAPIRRSFDATFFHHHHPTTTLGYCSYYGKKFDPEPGRCRRTDGKKWRCSKDAYPESKYCERHMHRGRSRSRKPVESQSTSQSLPTAISSIATGSSSGSGSFQTRGSGTFQNLPLYSTVNADNFSFGSNASKWQMEPGSYGVGTKEYRYLHGLTPDADEHNFSPEVSGSGVRGLEMDANIDNTWRLGSSQLPSSFLLKQGNDSHLQGNFPQLQMGQTFEPMIDDATMSKERHQHCFFGSNNIGSIGADKQEQHSMRPFFDEWPKPREAWSDLDDEKCTQNASSTTQLSICTPMSSSEFSFKNTSSSNDA